MVAGDEFPELLGRLKERSGLSYGVLGKRLHMSASTLHRYVNGDAVPTDYAPVERFARVCRATPEELLELHRRWILADARRGQKTGAASAKTGAASAETETRAETKPEAENQAETETEPRTRTAEAADLTPEPAPTAAPGIERPASRTAPKTPTAPRRRRTALLAATAVVAAVAAATLVVNLVSGEGRDERDGKQSVGAAASESADGSPRASGSPDAKESSASPSASRGADRTASASPSDQASEAVPADGAGEDGATAPTVVVNPYKWDNPCSQHYLIDQEAGQVPPPPSEPDARGWVKALGGVAAEEQMLALTVQGTGKATVVLEALHVRVVEKSAPLAWNDFTMGVGCGGGVETTSFGVDLDDARPSVSPRAGQRDFPYKVSESDPEVFYVFADARASNVSWYLELDWSSGDRHGTVRLDDQGNPFRTSGNAGRPAFTYPPGYSEWGPAATEPESAG
ncbi:helix-turn-helix domain-containing protein [Streptomyces sp. NPDC127072]|uniref:helix-turn-helix domain-containing protein n=1 Tax=Streptomyces sp. NPDC127072 TaxID=3347129 RepID=UPI0036520D4D